LDDRYVVRNRKTCVVCATIDDKRTQAGNPCCRNPNKWRQCACGSGEESEIMNFSGVYASGYAQLALLEKRLKRRLP
jgi:hypothetical protein